MLSNGQTVKSARVVEKAQRRLIQSPQVQAARTVKVNKLSGLLFTVPALRAMNGQMEELNGLLLYAEYDNIEFYRFAIQKM